MKNFKFDHAATITRSETVLFQVSFDVKDRRGLTRFKGISLGECFRDDKGNHTRAKSWRITIQTGSGAPNPFDQFLDYTDVVNYILDSLKVLRRMFKYGRFNVNIGYRQTNGSELVRYFTGEYFIVAAYDLDNKHMVWRHGVENNTLSQEYYEVRAAASQEEVHLGNARYAAALKDPDATEFTYQRLVETYEASLKWLNEREFNHNKDLVLTDVRAAVRTVWFEAFDGKKDQVSPLLDLDGWAEFYTHSLYSKFGDKDCYHVPQDDDFDVFSNDEDDDDSIFLDDEGYFDVD